MLAVSLLIGGMMSVAPTSDSILSDESSIHHQARGFPRDSWSDQWRVWIQKWCLNEVQSQSGTSQICAVQVNSDLWTVHLELILWHLNGRRAWDKMQVVGPGYYNAVHLKGHSRRRCPPTPYPAQLLLNRNNLSMSGSFLLGVALPIPVFWALDQ